MKIQTTFRLLELNQKWINASPEEREEILLELKNLIPESLSSEKIVELESRLDEFKTSLIQSKQNLDSIFLEDHIKNIQKLQAEITSYKQHLLSKLEN